jgi:RNA polymerase sigma factor (sigma-70 family)
MTDYPLDALLDKLCRGDAETAERVFLAYEPYLRMVVRRKLSARLRAKFDSMDVVQSVWVDLMRGFRDAGWHFENGVQLRAFLVRATRNRFIDRLRQHRNALRLERRMPSAENDAEALPPSCLPGPSELAQANELWKQLLAACPPAHHEVLRLKRQGLPLAEIAAQTGLHASSIRRILYEVRRRISLRRQVSPPSGDTPR